MGDRQKIRRLAPWGDRRGKHRWRWHNFNHYPPHHFHPQILILTVKKQPTLTRRIDFWQTKVGFLRSW
ncbi:toxin-antitoxin system TumE family protein [Laspinema olomoucense]|uniref:toxin-antitoxin system TumE family protein n=1 Tax=Laspinema olomoucense TaxID=3231600 RepID=UPI00339012E9